MRQFILVVLLVLTLPASAIQTTIPDYDTSRDEYFWPLFYVFGGGAARLAAVLAGESPAGAVPSMAP